MAWLDDSPVRQEGKFEHWKNEPRKPRTIEREEKWQFIANLPVFKGLFKYLQSRFVLRKLQSIERKIRSNTFDNLPSVLRLLNELKRLKKLSTGLHHNHIKHLKTLLISKSHSSMLQVTERPVTVVKPAAHGHKTIMGLLKETTHIVQPVPTKLYWRFATGQMPIDSYGAAVAMTQPQLNMVRLHTSVNKLIDLLKSPQGHLSNHPDIYPDWDDQSPSLVCGITFKYAPNFSPDSTNPHQQVGFWQNERSKTTPLMKLAATQVEELVFKTQEHFREFKDALTQNNESNLLELVFDLETRDQIKIHQSPSCSPAA